MNDKIIACVPRRRCKKWRICSECAKVRQAQIATVAEIGSKDSKFTSYAVIKPALEPALNKNKTKLVVELQKKTKGGIWTVEEGTELGSLHINMLLGSEKELNAGYLADIWAEKVGIEAEIWSAPVEKAEVRQVAAYISKKSQFPDKERYPTRLYGSWGGWKRPLGVLADSRHAIPAALSMEKMIENAGIELPLGNKESHQEMIARNARNQQERTKARVKSNMTRILAGLAGEIMQKGHVYVSGHGIKTLADLRDFGIITAEQMQKMQS